MPYAIRIVKAAEKDLANLSEPVRIRIMAAIKELAGDPRPPGVLKIEGFKGLYRIRVGSYRIAYEIHDRHLLILVTAAADRKSIYSLLKRRFR